MPNTPVLAAAIGLPDNSQNEPAFAITEAARMYLLLQTIVDRPPVEGSLATFEITPDLADELAAFGSESEDVEEDDPAEEDGSLEENEQLESDCRLEAYRPVEQKPTRRIR